MCVVTAAATSSLAASCCFILQRLISSSSPLPSLCSEIRLMEIMEGLCDSSSFECNRMLEEHEEHFETWWFKRWVSGSCKYLHGFGVISVTLGCDTTLMNVKDRLMLLQADGCITCSCVQKFVSFCKMW